MGVHGADGVSLLTLMASMPNGAGLGSRLPCPRRCSNWSATPPSVPSTSTGVLRPRPTRPTLAVAVASFNVADREVVLSSLAPQLRADVESSLDAVTRYAACP